MEPNETFEGNGSAWGSPPAGCAPSWQTMHAHLGWMLLLHVYGLGFCFFVLCFYAFFSILNLRSLISSRPFMVTINVFICLLGASRAASMFIDPYGLSLALPKAIGWILWDVGFPCVASALALMQLALLKLTQLKFGPELLKNKSCLSCVITSHFSVIIGADIAVAFSENFLVAKYTLQVAYTLWSTFLCVTFLMVGHKVRKLVSSVPSSLLACGPLDASHKGIMQLAMLAPYNNLATSVAAALVPTLLAPRIRITDEHERSKNYTPSDHTASTTTTTSVAAAPEAGSSWMGTETAEGGGWQKEAPAEEAAQQQESLLGPKPDYTLHTVLRHIALVSHSAAANDAGRNRKIQVQQVLRVTSATAALGVALCLGEAGRVAWNAGGGGGLSLEAASPWLWLALQTTSRSLELLMACAMAGVTKQAVVRPPQPFVAPTFRTTRPSLYM